MEHSDTNSESAYSDHSHEKDEGEDYGIYSLGETLLQMRSKFGKTNFHFLDEYFVKRNY
jgi:hypothetical protein